MRAFQKIVTIMMVLLIMLVALLFVLENQQSVVVGLVGWSLPPMPIAVIVLGALIAGLLLGTFFHLVRAFGAGRNSRASGR
ncbi:DUF1049 domain-containing protein [Pseudomonas sp. S75]|nr:DUF1049 domain-containing protein [Pseudomonas sp. S30]MBK0153195.1 DUF1049 domain-containing protein [Pseudomonas sp. S75]